MLARFGLYDFFANIIPGIFFLWALGTVLGIRELREALPLTGGLAETSVIIVPWRAGSALSWTSPHLAAPTQRNAKQE